MKEQQVVAKEHEGWRLIAEVLTKSLKRSVSIKTAQRYASPSYARPLLIGQRGDRTRFLRCDDDYRAWVTWFMGKPGNLVHKKPKLPTGDRRRKQFHPVASSRAQKGRAKPRSAA